MDKRERKLIMSEGAIRPETPQDRHEREVVAADLEHSPLKGRPLRRRWINWRPDGSGHLLAAGGPTAWMRRLREIEEETEYQLERLEHAWRELALECRGDEFARRWRDNAARWNFTVVNDLIERHNRNFPAEAKLAMDPRTGDFVKVNGRPYTKEPLDAEWILERFPPDSTLAVTRDTLAS